MSVQKISYIYKDDSKADTRLKYKINEHLILHLKGNTTFIYVAGELFQHCKSLAVALPENMKEFSKINNIESMDELGDLVRKYEDDLLEVEPLSPEEEFWGHCSNIETWYEHDYDTLLIDSGLGFPLLKKLTEVGDKKARKVFKEEIYKRMKSGHYSTLKVMNEMKLSSYLTRDEFWSLFPVQFAPLRRIEEILGHDFGYEGNSMLFGDKRRPHQGFYTSLMYRLSFSTEGEGEEMRLGLLQMSEMPEIEEASWEEVFRELGNMENLRYLNIYRCSIPRIPETFGKLKDLERVELRNNEIRELPDSMQKLTRLEFISLTDNRIREFPQCLTELKALKILLLIRNELEKIPDAIMNLVNLKELGLGGNNLRFIPVKIKNWLKEKGVATKSLDRDLKRQKNKN